MEYLNFESNPVEFLRIFKQLRVNRIKYLFDPPLTIYLHVSLSRIQLLVNQAFQNLNPEYCIIKIDFFPCSLFWHESILKTIFNKIVLQYSLHSLFKRYWHRPCARDLQSNVTLLMLVTFLGKSRADGHVIRSNITCLITLLQVLVVVVVSDVT